MKKILLIVALFFSLSSISLAQTNYYLRSSIEFYESHKLASGEYRNILTEKDIQGSPYLNDEFINGSIYTVSKTQFTDIPLRYNIYNQEIEFKNPENKVIALGTPEVVEKVSFGEYTMVYIPFSYNKKVQNGFLKVLSEGKVSLYARPEIEFQKPKEPGAYREAEPAKFVPRDDRNFIRIGKDAAQMVVNKKEVIEVFPDHNDEIEAFIKQNKINVKKQGELKSVVEYYNSL